METPTNLYLPESTCRRGIESLEIIKIARIAMENETFKVFLASCPIGFCLQILVTNSMGFDQPPTLTGPFSKAIRAILMISSGTIPPGHVLSGKYRVVGFLITKSLGMQEESHYPPSGQSLDNRIQMSISEQKLEIRPHAIDVLVRVRHTLIFRPKNKFSDIFFQTFFARRRRNFFQNYLLMRWFSF